MIEVFTSYFGNVINLSFSLMFIIIGILVRHIFQPLPKNQVLYCRERDLRGQELDVQREDGISVETKSSPGLRFFKYGPAFTFDIKRRFSRRARKVARFLAKESTAYTYKLLGSGMKITKSEKRTVKDARTGEEKEIDIPLEWEADQKDLELEFPTAADLLRFTCGVDWYNVVPQKYKDKMKDKKVLVTVGLEPGITPVGYEPITESIIMNKADEDMASLLARGVKGTLKKSALDVLPWVGTGIAIGLALVALGLLQVGPAA